MNSLFCTLQNQNICFMSNEFTKKSDIKFTVYQRRLTPLEVLFKETTFTFKEPNSNVDSHEEVSYPFE
jgi:hypothetical protein